MPRTAVTLSAGFLREQPLGIAPAIRHAVWKRRYTFLEVPGSGRRLLGGGLAVPSQLRSKYRWRRALIAAGSAGRIRHAAARCLVTAPPVAHRRCCELRFSLCSGRRLRPGTDQRAFDPCGRRAPEHEPEGRGVDVVRFRAGEPAPTVLHDGSVVRIVIGGKKKLKEISMGTLVCLDRSGIRFK